MSRHLRTLAVGTTIVAGLAAAPSLDAQDYLRMPEASMMGEGMMGQGGMMGSMMSGMMNMSGDMGDMDDMDDMDDMEKHCSEMMQSMMTEHDHERPNERWQREEPAPQDDLRPGPGRG